MNTDVFYVVGKGTQWGPFPTFKGAKDFALDQLKAETPPVLAYYRVFDQVGRERALVDKFCLEEWVFQAA